MAIGIVNNAGKPR